MEKIKCKKCKKDIDKEKFVLNYNVCPDCNYHGYVNARERLQITVDEDSFVELGSSLSPKDFLNFYDLRKYKERLEEAKLKSGLSEAILVGEAMIEGNPVSIGVMDFRFMGGSMGSVVGERIKLLVNNSIEKGIPLLIFSASGGARMQEGIVSLMQMAKTVSAINRLKEKRIPYFTIITNPTTGGVSASFATVADIIIAEPGALFCFAGPRVVAQTIKKHLPDDFGSSERNLKNGQVDMIVSREDIPETLSKLIAFFK